MIFKIHPAVGIARVGDSDEYYFAPAKAGALPTLPQGGTFTPADFRDAQRRVRRQGSRFQVYRYDESGPDERGVALAPGSEGVAGIEWTVHLVNKKAIWYQFLVNAGEFGYTSDHPLRNRHITGTDERTRLIIDPGPRTLSGPGGAAEFSRFDNPDSYPMTFPPEQLRPNRIDSLGGLRTDADGNLIVLGGFGCSGTAAALSIGDYANNDAWWDDTADGPVTATIIMTDGTRVEAVSAWAVVGPPRFAPQLVNLISLYDTMFDTAVRWMSARPDIYHLGLWNRSYRPSWEQDIRPIIERAHHYRWVAAIPPQPHDLDMTKLGDPNPSYNGLRAYYLSVVRSPQNPNLFTSPDTGLPMMPYLCGDNCFEPGPLGSSYATLTPTQYFFLQQWAAGLFTVDAGTEVGGADLDRAALENCVGGAFSPGIELTWISRNHQIYEEPFRIRHKRNVTPPLSLGQDLNAGLEPGDLCKYMALPWQADFNECSGEFVGDRFLWWWPVQRPEFVYVRHADRLKQVPWVGSAADQNAADYTQFADDLDMVTHWHQLGFVVNQGTEEHPQFVEVERTLLRPDDEQPQA